MSGAEAEQAAFHRVARLAMDHAGALDDPARAMAAQAWVGGGAAAFGVALGRQRQTLQGAFETALTELARRIARQGVAAPAVPAVRSGMTSMSAANGSFAGVEVGQLARLIGGLTTAAHELAVAGPRLCGELSALCLPAVPTLEAVGGWAASQAEDLRRRLALIQREAGGGLAPASLVAFGLYGQHAPSDVTGLLARAATGEDGALARLREAQRAGRDPTLAGRVNAWWRMLDPAARERLVRSDPGGIGILDGIPVVVRDRANRTFLAAEKALLTGAALAAEKARRAGTLDALKQLEGGVLLANRALFELPNIRLIEQGLAMGGRNGRPAAYLLAFDTREQGKAVVSFGDPDSADRVVTYVPGLGTNLGEFGGAFNRSGVLWDQAHYFAPGQKIASVAWLGYRAPQGDLSILAPGRSVAGQGAAAKGAGALTSFTDGLRASHEPGGTAKHTVLGHSYGSLVTGKAAVSRSGQFADDVVFVGSPGVSVDRAEELGVRPGHVWAGEAAGDPVADLESFGEDPGDDAFGAKTFYVADGPFYLTFAAHSSYWADDSESLKNLAHVVNGHYHKVTTNAGE